MTDRPAVAALRQEWKNAHGILPMTAAWVDAFVERLLAALETSPEPQPSAIRAVVHWARDIEPLLAAIFSAPDDERDAAENAVLYDGLTDVRRALAAAVMALEAGAALEAPPALTDAQAWELWEQLGGRDASGFANKGELADWVRAVVGLYVRGEAPPEPQGVRAWIQALPEDAIAQVVRAYTDADWDASGLSGESVDLSGSTRTAFASRAFRDALLSLVRGEAGPLPPESVVPPLPIHERFGVRVTGMTDAIDPRTSAHKKRPSPDEIAARLRGYESADVVHGVVPAPPLEPELLTRLRSLLETFGEHLSDCQRPDRAKDEGCTCGFRLNLQAVRDLVPYSYEGRAVPAPQEGPPGVAAYEGLLRAVDRGASAPPAGPDWKAAALACVVPMEALHADNLAGSQLIAPSLRVAIAEAVEALRKAVAGGASAPVPTGESGAASARLDSEPKV